MRGLILYGPPAAGKDTITNALCEVDPTYRLFPRLKVGNGRTTGYRMATNAALERLRAERQVIWENSRYDAVYVIDRPTLASEVQTNITVVHLGQIDAIGPVVQSVPGTQWSVAYLWCPRDEAARRIVERGTGDSAERLRAWDATDPLAECDIAINTADVEPAKAAAMIDAVVRSS